MVSLSCPAAAGAEGREGGESEREAPGRRSSQASSPRRSGPFIPRLFSPKPRHPCRSDCRRRAPRLRSSNVTPFSPHNRPDLATCSYALAAFHVRSLPSRVRDELVSQAKELVGESAAARAHRRLERRSKATSRPTAAARTTRQALGRTSTAAHCYRERLSTKAAQSKLKREERREASERRFRAVGREARSSSPTVLLDGPTYSASTCLDPCSRCTVSEPACTKRCGRERAHERREAHEPRLMWRRNSSPCRLRSARAARCASQNEYRARRQAASPGPSFAEERRLRAKRELAHTWLAATRMPRRALTFNASRRSPLACGPSSLLCGRTLSDRSTFSSWTCPRTVGPSLQRCLQPTR